MLWTFTPFEKQFRSSLHFSFEVRSLFFSLTVDYRQISTEYYHYNHMMTNSGESSRRKMRRGQWGMFFLSNFLFTNNYLQVGLHV